MRRIDCGISGSLGLDGKCSWEDLNLGGPWDGVIALLSPGPNPRPAQAKALGELQILESRRNLIVSAPTNAGKSLIGLLALIQAIKNGRRAILLEPLRAIAREKTDELERIAPELSEVLGCEFSIKISTGDYRLDDEDFAAPPPDTGELIVATPERLDAILRNPDHDGWLSTVDAVCVDEAHLISDSHRGATLEYVMTTLLCLPSPPRLILLSATMGNLDRATSWLHPCDALTISERCPPLRKEVLELEGEEEANQIALDHAREVLADPGNQLLIFVYQTRAAESLAKLIGVDLRYLIGVNGASAYHAQMSAAQREETRRAFLGGECRCVVSTTALGLGVNLPATHVLVRDSVFPGAGTLGAGELLQMMGRAGRGDRAGQARVIVRPSDTRSASELANALREEVVPDLVSNYERQVDYQTHWQNASAGPDIPSIATHIMALLGRRHETGVTTNDLRDFFERSLGGKTLVAYTDMALSWLCERTLAYWDEQERYFPTVLGLKATRAVLPLGTASGIAQLLRDLMTVDSGDGYLGTWELLDHLILLDILSDRSPNLRNFGNVLVVQIDGWMEGHSGQIPLLFREWIRGAKGKSKAGEVLGSLGVSAPDQSKDRDEWARRSAYMATFRAIVMYERGMGTSARDLERKWKIKNLEGIEERWRDALLWLLAGVSKILEIRCFYYHLVEECNASPDRIKKVKRLLKRMQRQTHEMQEHIKYCSALGPILRRMRKPSIFGTKVSVGTQTIRLLESKGIRSPEDLVHCQVPDLVTLGVRKHIAKQIVAYMKRSLR